MENIYTKIIGLKGYHFTKEYEKKKISKTRQREIREETVQKFFKAGDCHVRIVLLEQEKEFLLTPDSPREEILKYLGEKFAGEF
ncbi:MAG: hypothetical protein ACRDA4_01680 [Filifactoraceae bacterium]